MAKLKIGKTKRKTGNRNKGSNSAAFVMGSLFGGFIGAVTALWKTPQSGQELRSKVTGALNPRGSDTPPLSFSTASPSTSTSTAPVGDKAPGEATGEPTTEGIGHIATTEELVRPPATQQ